MAMDRDVLVTELIGLRQQMGMISDRIGFLLGELTKEPEEKEDKRPVTFGSRQEILNGSG
jgi:hypothetical protein